MRRIIFSCLPAAGSLYAQAGRPVDPAKGLTLANEHVRLEFEPQGMGLAAMVDLQSGRNRITKVDGRHLLGSHLRKGHAGSGDQKTACLGILLANYVDQQVPFEYRIDPKTYGLPSDEFSLTEISSAGRRSLGKVSGALHRTEHLAPSEIKAIEMSPVSAK